MTTLRQAAGSLLIAGLEGPTLTGLDRAWLKLIQPAGIILFRRNIESAPQTRALLAEATQYCTPNHLRCVDLEGGLVDRLRDALAPQPSAQAVAQTGKPALMQKHGELIARECRAFGFNTTLAPVLDLGLPISAEVMRTRPPGSTPEAVATYAEHFLQGLGRHQITGCAKHYPGLGGGTLDSHHATPYINRTYRQIWTEDLAPYRVLSRQLSMVMVSHAAFPPTRSRQSPATISPFWITTVLKQRLNYRGLIFSDDMEMGGILNQMPIEEAVPAAVRAGIHLIEICRSPELLLRAFESLLTQAERSPTFRRILLTRAAECRRLRTRRFSALIQRALTPTQLIRLTQEVHKFSAAVEQSQPKESQPQGREA
jgi:beta-N-acetylhexosaminidase